MEYNFSRTLDVNNSVLLLVDYQESLLEDIELHSRADIENNVLALAKGVEALGIPAILTTIRAKANGPFFREIIEIFPNAPLIDRQLSSFDVLEDRELLDALQQSGKKQLVLSGLWTSMCMCHTTLHGLSMGFDVLGFADTSGSQILESHNAALQKLIKDGAVCTCHLNAGRFRMDM